MPNTPSMYRVILVFCYLACSYTCCLTDDADNLLQKVLRVNASKVILNKITRLRSNNFKSLAILTENEQDLVLRYLSDKLVNDGYLEGLDKKLFNKLFKFTSTAIKHRIENRIKENLM